MELTTATTEFLAAIEEAKASIPSAHRLFSAEGKVVRDLKSGFQRFQNWAFTQLFALATRSTSDKKGKKLYKFNGEASSTVTARQDGDGEVQQQQRGPAAKVQQ